MVHYRIAAMALISLSFATASAKTYKDSIAAPCNQVWDAVKVVLADTEHYDKVVSDDASMKADYAPKHTVHVDVSGVLLQRMNHVTLVPKSAVCEMQVVSNYSGWGHDDKADFRKRVADAMTKLKAPATAEPAKSEPAKSDAGH